jgi:hypothetical protein
MEIGTDFVLVDANGQGICEFTRNRRRHGEPPLDPSQSVLIDDQNLVIRTQGRGFVHIRRRGGDWTREDISQRIQNAAGLADYPLCSNELNRYVVAIPFNEHALVVDLRDIVLG